MKVVTKVLATLMLVGLFSTTTFAWVDCFGLQGYKTGYGNFDNDKDQCEKFQLLYGNTDRDWVSKKTGIIRYANTEWNGVNEYRGDRNLSVQHQPKPVQKAVKTTMTMDEIRAYKFDPALNGIRTTEKDLIAKTLIEKYDLWNAYRLGAGFGVKHVLKKNGFEYAGDEINEYSKDIHSGNAMVYMDNNFSLQDVKKKLGVKFSDFAIMEIDPDDFMEGKVSVRDFNIAYVKVIIKKLETDF